MNYLSIEEAITDLRKRGYSTDFSAETETVCLYCGEMDMRFDPAEFQIDEVHRFDCNATTDNNALLYAISDPASGLKGTLIDALGTSSCLLIAHPLDVVAAITNNIKSGK